MRRPTLVSERGPFDHIESPHRLQLGLSQLGADEPWLAIDDRLADDLDEKERLLSDVRDQVLVELPSSRPAQTEVRSLVAKHAATLRPDLYNGTGVHVRRAGAGPSSTDVPIEQAARLVQEDLCVMERGDDHWCLTAACVCFPSRWDLPSKLGLPLTALHAAVPGYSEVLAQPSDRFFDRMKTGRRYARRNWSLGDDPALYLPQHKSDDGELTLAETADLGACLWLRAEHQTLQRLPQTDAILFTIRIHRARLGDAAADPRLAEALSGALRTLEPGMTHYKSLDAIKRRVIDYLDDRGEH